MLGLGVCLHWDGSKKVANRPGCVQSKRRAGTETYGRPRRSHMWDYGNWRRHAELLPPAMTHRRPLLAKPNTAVRAKEKSPL